MVVVFSKYHVMAGMVTMTAFRYLTDKLKSTEGYRLVIDEVGDLMRNRSAKSCLALW